MRAIVLQDTTVELITQDDISLRGITHLILLISLNGRIINKASLLSQHSSPWKWEADRSLVMPEVAVNFLISVIMDDGGNERQMIACMELNGLDLCNPIVHQYEVPLMGHGNYPGLVLKTSTKIIEDIQEVLAGGRLNNIQAGELSHRGTIEKMLVEAFTARQDFLRYGRLERLHQAISQYRHIIEFIPEDDPNFPDMLESLGVSLRYRFEQLGELEDVNEAIKRLEMAIIHTPDGDQNKPSRLSNLGSALIRRFEHRGDLDDLDKAIRHQQAAADLTPANGLNKNVYLNNLGNCLKVRFERLGNLDDLENSISQIQKSVELTPDTDVEKPVCLITLGGSLYARFLSSGSIADIDGAIAQVQLAVTLTPDGHPNKPSRLSNLGCCLVDRFERLGNLVDLNNAILQQQQAVTLTPDRHPQKPGYLRNLGSSLNTRYARVGDEADINNAIAQLQLAVNLIPAEHPDKPGVLSTLGISLWERFSQFGNPDDIDSSIAHHRMAVDLVPADHPNLSDYFGNLGNSFWLRFMRLGNLADLDNAIECQERGVDLTPRNHSSRSSQLSNLSRSFMHRFYRCHDVHDAEVSISHSAAAATSPDGPPMTRFKAVNSWVKLAYIISHESLLAAYECALDLMPLVAWLGLPIADRHDHLTKMGGIARNAAAAAISAERYEKALEWLEQGRSIVWTQILHLRTPVDQLREVDPELADRLLQVSRLLDRGTQDTSFQNRGNLSIEEQGRQYRASTSEWESIIKQVRLLPNFENFLRPLPLSRLINAAHNGPVVVFNIAETRCDALALLPELEDVIHIPLPNITSKRVTELRDELKNHLYSSGIRMRDIRAAVKFTDENGEENCRQVLAELWKGLVKPVLDGLAFSPHPDVLPRIWWCATGPLAFLPIHAAGIYGPESGDSQLSNYVISSYIPTLSMLLDRPNSPIISFRLLSVIQSSAPGASSIPNTKQELQLIRRRLAGRDHVVLEGETGTKRKVMKGMEECNWLHLACHGIQVPDEPTKSALLLDDGHLTLEEIIKLDLPNAEFAFLSACQTTTGDESLSEEAVHIAGGMLLAGYRGVVATMWSIQDELAPMVTDEFYRHTLEEGKKPDVRKAAEALHKSVQKLRTQPGVQLTDWIPFVHLGV